MSQQTLLQSLLYQPVASRFGTSGVRALVTDLTDLEVYSLTLGVIRYLKQNGKLYRVDTKPSETPIPIASDLRASSERIVCATARAIVDAGYRFENMGTIPTPALSYYALRRGVAAFMITGSHIPADRNGQKAMRCDGEVMKSDEAGIVAAVEAVRQRLYQMPVEQSLFDRHGMLNSDQKPDCLSIKPTAEACYRERYQAVFSAQRLKGLRILFYQYCAVGRDLIPAILAECGAEVIRCGRSDQFEPIDTEAISERHLQILSKLVVEQRKQHGRIDLLISTDGDSDRPLVIGVEERFMNERWHHLSSAGKLFAESLKGNWCHLNGWQLAWRRLLFNCSPVSVRFFPGDLLGIIVANYLKADAVATPISASPAVNDYFLGKNIQLKKTRIGSPYVIEAVREALQDDCQRAVAWESNGGFLLGSAIELNGGQLEALPTRDAVLPILALLYSVVAQRKTVAELFDQLPKWSGAADLIDNFPQSASRAIIEFFKPLVDGVEWVGFQQGNVLLCGGKRRIISQWRENEAEAQRFVRQKQVLEAVFSSQMGFEPLSYINLLDGVRCFFGDNEVVHIRPSGNAPQLRIYAYARDPSRAARIVTIGIAEPDGLLRRLAELSTQSRNDSIGAKQK